MKFIATLVAVATLAVAGSAAAAPLDFLAGNYVQGSVGGQFQDNRADATSYSVAVGRDFGTVRVEGEYVAGRGSDNAKLGTVESNLGNINVFVEPVTVLGVTPFVGAGVGYGSLYGAGVKGDRNGTVFNAQAGATYKLTKDIDLVGSYRYWLAADVDVQKAPKIVEQYRASTLSVGVRYTF
jgi:opacity protein-like surface antigen